MNTDQSFVASPRKRTSGPKREITINSNSSPQLYETDWNGFTYFIAMPEQKRLAVEITEPELMKAEVSNLWGFVTVFHDQITRTLPSNKYRPSIDELKYAIDQIRNQMDQTKLDKDWQYGFLLYSLLDRTAQRSFRTFQPFQDRPPNTREIFSNVEPTHPPFCSMGTSAHKSAEHQHSSQPKTA